MISSGSGVPGGASVRACLDRRRLVESVWVGPRLVSRAPAGAKPDGHTVPVGGPYRDRDAEDVRVSFDIGAETCSLWVQP